MTSDRVEKLRKSLEAGKKSRFAFAEMIGQDQKVKGDAEGRIRQLENKLREMEQKLSKRS